MSRHRKTCVTCKERRATYALQSGRQLIARPILCAYCTLSRVRWGVPRKVLTSPKEFSHTLDFHNGIVVYRNSKSVSIEMKEIFEWPVKIFNEYLIDLTCECGATAIIKHYFLSRRKARLFIIACLRELSHHATPKLLFILNDAEEFADHQELDAADYVKRARKAANIKYESGHLTQAFVDTCIVNCLNHSLANFESGQFFGLLVSKSSDCLRNVFSQFADHSLVVDEKCATDTAKLLAKQMYERNEFSAMPILADALQDADCDNEKILKFCREGPWYKGNLVVDSILNKS